METARKNVTIDWTVRENVLAQLRLLVKRILRKRDGPTYRIAIEAVPDEATLSNEFVIVDP